MLLPWSAVASLPEDSIAGYSDEVLLKQRAEMPALDFYDDVPLILPDTTVCATAIAIPAYEKSFDWKIPFERSLRVNNAVTTLPEMGLMPGVSPIDSWEGGTLFSIGGRIHLAGMMGIERGSVNFRQQIGAFTLSLFGSATKYGFYRGLATSYGFGGSVSYDINEHVGITLFGAYHSPTGIDRASMISYVDVPVFGGYMDWRGGNHWGVKVGVQSYRSIAYGRWEAQPIVMPYYRTSSGAEIGVDVGGILYQVIRSSGNSWGAPRNPTVGRPDFGPPPVGPRK